MNAHCGPLGLQRNLLRPLDDHHGLLAENVLQAKRFKVVKTHHAIKIRVIDARRAVVPMHQRESGAGYILLLRRTQAADDSFCERGLPRPEIA